MSGMASAQLSQSPVKKREQVWTLTLSLMLQLNDGVRLRLSTSPIESLFHRAIALARDYLNR